MKKFGITLIALGLASTAACGGSSRPSADDLSKALTSKKSVIGTALTKTQADCASKILVDSKVSSETLNALVENNKDYEGSKSEGKKLTTAFSKVATECAVK